MAGALMAANHINASTAGQTRPEALATAPGAPQAATPTEVLPNFIHGVNGHLESILSGGSHPEGLVVPVSTQLAKATDSLRGRLGGLVPHGTAAPGPAGPTATAAANAAREATQRAEEAVSTATSRVRRFLRI